IPHTEHISAKLEGWTAILEFLMEYTLTSWLASFFIYILGGFFTLYISIFIAIIVVGFLTPLVLKELQQRHYQDIEMIGYGSIIESIFVIMKSSSVMVMLFFLLIPLYFIPIINIIAINFPLYYFFHKMITFDIASTICTREESKKIKYFNANMLRAKTLFLYITSLIPFTVFFTTIFFVIYLGNTYFVEIKKLRTES
ncbi:MAG: EI24 domain-containing protein, partial [Campylobacterota bacterium]|nr:EI24 domain-containing protein [Campylobacterota bacterium]